MRGSRFIATVVILAGLCPSLRADLVSQWEFDGDLLDTVGGNNGTYVGTGGPLFVADPYGTASEALSFNGTNEYVSVNPGTGLSIHNLPVFSLTFFVKGPTPVTGVTDRKIFAESSTPNNNTPIYALGSANAAGNKGLDFFFRNDANATSVNHVKSALPVLDDTWHHVAWIDDNGTVTCYIDGIKDTAIFNYTRSALTSNATTFGALLRASAGSLLAMSLDDFRFFDHAVTLDEVKAIILSGCPAEGDTTCTDLQVAGPPAGQAGLYTLTATGADTSGDTTLYYTFKVVDDLGNVFAMRGPQTANTTTIGIGPGNWTVSVAIDDNPICGAGVCSQALAIAPAPGLVAHWPLDGGLADATGSGNDGTFVTVNEPLVPTFVDGFDGTVGGALQLDGVDDYVNILPAQNLPIYLFPAFTVAVWVKGPLQGDKRVYSEGSSTTNNTLLNLGTMNTGAFGKADIYVRNDANVAQVNHRYSDRIAFDDTWHHIAYVDDGGKVTLSIDGVRDAGSFEYVRSVLNSNRVSLGAILRATAGSFFLGAIDEVRLYNYALTAAEVSAIVPEIAGCPADGDTHLTDVAITPPDGGGPGTYTVAATAIDDSADPILYTYLVEDTAGVLLQQVGPTADLASTGLVLASGTYRITVSVDDVIRCKDVAVDASRTVDLTVNTEAAILVARWPLDGDLIDAVTTNPAIFFPAAETPTFGEGFDSNPTGALVGDGVNDFFQSGANTKLPLTRRADFSIALWVKGPAATDALRDLRIFSESSSVSTNFLFNLGTDNTVGSALLSFFYRDDGGTTVTDHARSTKAVFDGKWHHVAWVDRNGAATLYIDGQPDATDFTYIRSAAHAPDITTIGGILRPTRTPPESHWFNGSIDEVNLFNYGISVDQVIALYRAGCPADGDTHCSGVDVVGPAEGVAGSWTATATAVDDSGDPIIYTFTATNGGDPAIVKGPQAEATAAFDLTPGAWTISAEVDDDPICLDAAIDAISWKAVEVLACPVAGDTHCTAIDVVGPAEGVAGTWTATATAVDDSGNPIIYTFKADNGVDPAVVKGPQAEGTAAFDLTPGAWTISAEVDDDPACPDAAIDAILTKAVEVLACPAAGDTHCSDLAVAGPEGGFPGTYTATATAADDGGNPVSYTFTATNGVDPAVVKGPQAEATAAFELTVGAWTISVFVDDDAACPDEAADARREVAVTVVAAGGRIIPGDCNKDGTIDISDAICTLGVLFIGTPPAFPCGDGTSKDAGNKTLLDWQPDGLLDLTDAVAMLFYLYMGGVPHAFAVPGAEREGCIRIIGCPDMANCE
jgi:hypothetical protein